jgi:hypothetical protein
MKLCATYLQVFHITSGRPYTSKGHLKACRQRQQGRTSPNSFEAGKLSIPSNLRFACTARKHGICLLASNNREHETRTCCRETVWTPCCGNPTAYHGTHSVFLPKEPCKHMQQHEMVMSCLRNTLPQLKMVSSSFCRGVSVRVVVIEYFVVGLSAKCTST